MNRILTWLTVLALVAVALSAELPLKKDAAPGDLKTASSFVGVPFGYGWGWGLPYYGYGWGGWGYGGGWGGWGHPYWG